jgi:hypothetical protein
MSECMEVDGEYPEYYQPAHCSANDKEATSCYDARYAYAEKEIIRCHEIGALGGDSN